jgi:hypothetical protein
MLPFSSRVCALACALFALTPFAQDPPPLPFESVLATDPEDPIEIVEVLEGGPQVVRLKVYHGRPKKEVRWDSDQGQAHESPVQLGPGEDLLVSQDGRVIGVRALLPRDEAPKEQLLSALQTHLRFSKDLEGGEVAALESLDGARGVHASRGARTLLLAQALSEHGGAAIVEIYGRADGKLELKTSYTTERHGRVRLSDDGRLIVQEDGAQLKLRNSAGEELGEVPAGTGFELQGRREVLAVLEPGGVRFVPLDDQTGAPRATGQRVPLEHPPLGVAVAGGYALVFTTRTLHWIDWRAGKEQWTKNAQSGRYASVDAQAGPSGQALLAVGRIDVKRPAGRRGGTFRWGEAEAVVEVLDAQGEPLCGSHRFETARWSHNAPHVRILGPSRRILVRSGDSVQVSAAVP